MFLALSFITVLAVLAGLSSMATDVHGVFWTFFGATSGACIASFINVVVYRLPVMMNRQWTRDCREHLELPQEPEETAFNLSVPASHCPSCSRAIRAYELVPVLSYLALRGKCAGCKGKISQRYPLVELSGALLVGAVIALYGPTPIGLALSAFVLTSLAMSLIDADTFLIPDEISQPLLWGGLLLSVAGIGPVLSDAVLGAAVGYGSLWLMNAAFKLYKGKEGMGAGDFKYLAACGAFLGWRALVTVTLIASVTGVAVGLVGLWKTKESKPFPFGPHLALGACAVLFLRPFPVAAHFLTMLGL